MGLEVVDLVGLEGLAGWLENLDDSLGDRGGAGHHPLLGQGCRDASPRFWGSAVISWQWPEPPRLITAASVAR